MTNEKNTQIRVQPLTRDKLDAIASAKRWKLATTVDALADDFLEREGIEFSPTIATRTPVRRGKRPAAQ